MLPDPSDGKGSSYTEGPAVTQFAAPLNKITQGLRRIESRRGHEIDAYKIIVCRSIHTMVRSLLEATGPFNTASLHQHLAGLSTILEEFARSREGTEM